MDPLRDAISGSETEDGCATVSFVGKQIGNKTSFDSRDYGSATLSKRLAATQAFGLRAEGTSQVAVRDKRAGRHTGSA